ncbi:MAG TPA: hypothetical protein VGK38_15440 [Prolixibacteraceae bacterium]
MKRKNTFHIFLALMFAASVLVIIQIRCRHDDLNASTLDKVCYETDIARIFSTCNAADCHGSSAKGGYTFTDYLSVKKAITPFNAQKSLAYKAITGKGFTQLMPPSGALPEADRILLRIWIDQGAVNVPCSTSGTGNPPPVIQSDKVCFQRDILPVIISSCGSTRINGTTTVGCHDQLSHKEGYTITSYASVMSNLVTAGSPTTSKLYSVITRSPSAENFMPPSPFSPLTTAVKDSIFNWIKNGALNDVCTSLCDTTGVITYQNQISTVMAKNCTSCHSGTNASKGILLDSYAAVKTYLDNGKLLAAVKGTSIQMPPGYKITTCELREIELWKANGALQN